MKHIRGGVSFEDTEWNPAIKKKKAKYNVTQTKQLIEDLKPGDCKRIIHNDIACGSYGSCSLSNMICLKRKQGWVIEFYHESEVGVPAIGIDGYGSHIAVVRRIK